MQISKKKVDVKTENELLKEKVSELEQLVADLAMLQLEVQ